MRPALIALAPFAIPLHLGAFVAGDDGEQRVLSLLSKLGTREAGEAIEGLVEIGLPAVPPLVATARGGTRRGGQACEALARIGSRDALDAVSAAARGEDLALRLGALGALAHAASERSIAILSEAVCRDTDRRARQIAASSLGRIGSRAAVAPLVSALGDEWEWVRAEAATALGQIGAPEGADGLVGALSDVSWSVGLRARRALVAIGPPAVVALARTVHAPDPGVRWRAAWALGQIGNEEARRILEVMHEDADWRIRNEVEAAAERRGGTPASLPTFHRTGLHSVSELRRAASITGRSFAEITDLGRPGALSEAGFLAEDEDLRSVLLGDNALVARLGLTHPELARPLLHVWHRLEADCRAGRWDSAAHRWNGGPTLTYEDQDVLVEAHDTKGGQESIFDDGLQGAFWIRIRREPTPADESLLLRSYGHLSKARWALLLDRLTTIQTGEIQPHYVQRYGFYEGHTEWRVDPIAIAFVFGLRTLDDIEAAFSGRLDEVLTAHFVR